MVHIESKEESRRQSESRVRIAGTRRESLLLEREQMDIWERGAWGDECELQSV